MAKKPLFDGLIFDENNQPADVAFVGDESCYVIDDQGFKRHIPSENIDRQVIKSITSMIDGHEDLISAQTAQMIGQDDPFTRAMITNQLRQIEIQMETLFETGIPEDARSYLGMMGFRIKINIHGEIIEIIQPGIISEDDE